MNTIHEMDEKLGQSLHVTGWTVECDLSPQAVEAALVHLVEQIRMDTGGMDAWVQAFPIQVDGLDKGGAGVTAVQPLVESFTLGIRPAGCLIGDTWTDHNHAFFVIASCRTYDVRQVGDWLHAYVGKVLDFGTFDLKGCAHESA